MTEKKKVKKKLLVFHPALAPYRVDLFNSLHELYDTRFYFLNKNVLSQKFSQQKLIDSTNIYINYLNAGFTLFGRFFRFGIYRILKREAPSIVLSTEYSTITLSLYFLSKILLPKIKLYTLTEDNISMMENASRSQIRVRKFLLKRIDGVIVTHKNIAEYYKQKLGASTKFIIFPTIRTEFLYREQLSACVNISNKSIKSYGLEGKHILLYVGRLVEVKNLKRLIEAFTVVNKQIKNSLLVLVGDGDQKKDLEHLVENSKIIKSVIFTGRLEGLELLSWYNISNVFILPSTFEPFGAVINEALLAGCYSIVTKISGGACLIEEGINGITFNPFDIDEMANSIKMSFLKEKPVSTINRIKDSKMLTDYSSTIYSLFDKLQ